MKITWQSRLTILALLVNLSACRMAEQKASMTAQEAREKDQAQASRDRSSNHLQGGIVTALKPPACPQSQSYKIVGGKIAQGDDLATASTIKIWVRNQRFCTGTLIGKQHLVTAAHCLKDLQAAGELRLGFGPEGKLLDSLKVTAFKMHPAYKGIAADDKGIREQAFHDVALIIFEGALELGMIPVALAQTEQLYIGMPVILSGYGSTSSSDKQRRPLSLAHMQLASMHAEFRELQLETGKGKGACFGDSGGPTFISGEGDRCLYLVGATMGPGRNTDLSCESGGGTLMDLTRYQGWLACAAEELGAPLATLSADSSKDACLND